MRRPVFHRECRTRDGRAFTIREAELDDAPQLIAHSRRMLAEPQWNITEPFEMNPSIDQEEAWILSFRERPRNILLIADFGTVEQPKIAGLLSFNQQPRLRMRHRGRLGIGVQAEYRRLGVGEALMRCLLEWAASDPELERIELSVFAHNARALSLYQKLGFVEEARLARAYKLRDGTYYDEVMMVKWIR